MKTFHIVSIKPELLKTFKKHFWKNTGFDAEKDPEVLWALECDLLKQILEIFEEYIKQGALDFFYSTNSTSSPCKNSGTPSTTTSRS